MNSSGRAARGGSTRHGAFVMTTFALLGLAFASPAAAQVQDTAQLRRQAEQRLGRNIDQAEIMSRLRASGMSRAEVRSRLQMMGRDPSLADPYFDALQGRTSQVVGSDDAAFVAALQEMGMDAAADTSVMGQDPADMLELELLRADYRFRADSIYKARIQRQDSIAMARAGITDAGLPLFGRTLFARRTTEFQPLRAGPVSPSYVLGPGDEVQLVLTGDVELAYSLDVTRGGFLIIPDVGQINVNGMTLGQLENALYNRLGSVYSGVRRGPEATTHFQVSLGELRTSQVYVVGEAEMPGSYEVGAMGTVFNGLYEAGGPAVTGSFRNVEVKRNGRPVAQVDLYDYLLQGEAARDVRLENGDMVFVPLAGPRVAVRGEVRRPAVYEVRQDEGLRDVLRFAGGFGAQAVVERVQIQRVLPPGQRRPGVDRVTVDVPLEQLLSRDTPIPVHDGDVITVFEVAPEQRHYVALIGEVNRPGTYEWRPGLTLEQVLRDANGLRETAYGPRAHVFRLNEADGSRSLMRVSLEDIRDGAPPVRLADRDSIVVYSRERLRTEAVVEVRGLVKDAGEYVLAEGMTLQDLILAAGGFEEGAYELEAEVARRPDPALRTDTTAQVIRVGLTEGGSRAVPRGDGTSEVPAWRPGPAEVELQHGDRVFVRRAPGFEGPRVVRVTGEVLFPGLYVLESRQERLAQVIGKAGGLTNEAFPEGFRLIRGGKLVGTDLTDALEDPGSRDNVMLEPGDSLHVPTYDGTVLITGAVAFETRALYAPGRDLGYYIAQAGGYTDEADKDRVAVTYPNGERQIVDKVLFWRLAPDVRPGSQITVPAEPANQGFNWDRFLTQSLAVATTAATVLIAIDRIEN